ncbi:MAG: response regulator transcription factor [Deltaproteobacteria bacterium]|nr:response regulator transcription factor [Deltaproteobacteria bacterium]
MSAHPAKLVLADDHTLVREGIRGLIEARMPEAQVVGEAASGREALQLCTRLQPDLLVLDVSMPDLNGMDVLAELHSVSPLTRTAIVSQYTDRAYVIRALRLGAKAYLPKVAAARDLVAALRAVLAGRTWLDPSVADLVVDAALHPAEPNEPHELAQLTAREREVLGLVAQGRTGPEMAKILGISLHTANRHRANLMEKLGAHSKTDLVKLAVRLGVVAV